MMFLAPAWRLLIVLMLLTGCVYPVLITGIAQIFFPWKANGSLVMRENKYVGSQLIGQYVDSDVYFWGRPSATLPMPYNGLASGGSNLSWSNPRLIATIKNRINERQFDKTLIPGDLVMASASGLDPDISPAAAYYQMERVAKNRTLSLSQLHDLIEKNTQKRDLGFLGEPRVNVLQLNLALDEMSNLDPVNQ